MSKSIEFKLNGLMRSIIEKSYNGSQAEFARAMKITKQSINKLYKNNQRLGWQMFVRFVRKSGYNVKISVDKIK